MTSITNNLSAGRRLPGTPEPMHRWPGADGVYIAGDAWGDPQGPLVLLQHGGGQTRHAWKGTGQRLAAAGCFAVAFDARGHGDSDWAADGRYGTDAMIDDLRCVVAALGRPRPVLVGASMGGVTSLIAVGEGLVDALALLVVDTAPLIEAEGVGQIQAFMTARPEGFGSLDDVADAIQRYRSQPQPHRQQPRQLDGLAKNVRLGADGRYRWHWDPRYRAGHSDPVARRLRMKAAARQLAVPTLLVRGGLSDLLSEAGALHFIGLNPAIEYVSVAGAAHMVAGERNDVFGSAVLAFLQRHLAELPALPQARP